MKQQNKHLDLHPNNRSSLIIEKQLGITGDYSIKLSAAKIIYKQIGITIKCL